MIASYFYFISSIWVSFGSVLVFRCVSYLKNCNRILSRLGVYSNFCCSDLDSAGPIADDNSNTDLVLTLGANNFANPNPEASNSKDPDPKANNSRDPDPEADNSTDPDPEANNTTDPDTNNRHNLDQLK